MTTTAQEPDFGQYELLARLGEGPRGPAFVARRTGDAGDPRDPTADPLYVLELSVFATGEDEPLRAFMRDITSVGRIRHTNLVGIVEIGATTVGHYVVMDHVDGATLSAIQDRQRAIRPPRLVMAAMLDALHGLHAVHTIREDGIPRPLVHGSLSPDHLSIGLDGTCRVAGFGNMRPRVQTKPSHRSRAATGYMAPEQLTGAAVDPRTDLFALGVVLWNALTGRRLFHDRVEHMTMSNVLERRIPRPSTIGLCPPPALDAVVMKALDRDPAHRFQGAAEMAGALRDAARTAACLAAEPELAAWVTATFGNDLAARRRAIRELGAVPATRREIVVLPPLGGAAPADGGASDELSLDELARATWPLSRPSPVAGTPIADPAPPLRRQLSIVAAASFTVVAVVLGWRWSAASSTLDEPTALEAALVEPSQLPGAATPPPPAELEVTVLDVHRAAAPAPAPAPAATVEPATAPPAAVIPTSPVPPPAAATPTSPTRTPPRMRKVLRPHLEGRPEARPDGRPEARPEARPEVRRDPETRPIVEPRPDPTPPRPETPPRPTLESNPYLYK